MSEVFERQEQTEQRCTLHALNNVLQIKENYATYEAFHKIIESLSHGISLLDRQLHDNVQDNIMNYHTHKKEFGFHDTSYSLSVALKWLEKNNIKYRKLKRKEFSPPNENTFKRGQNYYLFTKIDQGTSNHAIAIVDGYILDSLEKEKMKFDVNLCTGVNPKYSIQDVWKIDMNDLKILKKPYDDAELRKAQKKKQANEELKNAENL